MAAQIFPGAYDYAVQTLSNNLIVQTIMQLGGALILMNLSGKNPAVRAARVAGYAALGNIAGMAIGGAVGATIAYCPLWTNIPEENRGGILLGVGESCMLVGLFAGAALGVRREMAAAAS